MNFYKRHLGDFAKSLSHLSQGAIGAYDLLIDWIYSNERALPKHKPDLYQIGRARTKAERDNVDRVVAEFFIATGAGYTQKRINEELEKYAAKCEQNQRIGKLGGRPKVSREVTETDSETQTETVTKWEPRNNPSQNPESNTSQKQKQPPAALPACPDWIESEAWAGFVAMRTKERHPLTARAAHLIFKALDEHRASGADPNAILDQSTRNGWRDVFAIKPNGGNGHVPKESLAARVTRKYLAEQAAAERADRAIGHDDAEPVAHDVSFLWGEVGQR